MVGLFAGQELAVVKAVGIAQQAFEVGNENGLAELVNSSLVLRVDGLNEAQDGGLLAGW